MVGIDQPQTRKWLQLSDAERVDWRPNSRSQAAESGDHWREAINLSSVCDGASGTAPGVNLGCTY